MNVDEIIEWLTKIKPIISIKLMDILSTLEEEGIVEMVAEGKNFDVAPQSSAGIRIDVVGNNKLYVFIICEPQEEWVFQCLIDRDNNPLPAFVDDLLTKISGVTLLLRRPFVVNRYINVAVFNNHPTENRIIKVMIFGFRIPSDVFDLIKTYLHPWEWSK